MSSRTLSRKLIDDHLVSGTPVAGEAIALRVDQTLTQDATGTMVMLELEAMGLEYRQAELSAQYVDHNLLQEDFKNPDDHLFLRSACRRFGIWYSPPGNGVSHPVHQQRFGIPGKTLVGSDSHTPAAGGIGMLAFGAGGIEVAMAIAGEPLHLEMPEIWGIRLVGELPEWVSAKDVILELLRRHDVDGGRGRILEYSGPGLGSLRAMDRHVLANMGTELGATTSIFPSDEEVRRFLRSQGREDDWRELRADPGASYDVEEEVDLSTLEPLIAMPSSPGNVRPVREVAGEPVYQAYVGSSANPGFRDFAVAAEMVRGRSVQSGVSFDVNPTSKQLLRNLIAKGHLESLVAAGARLHQAGCNGCIGMGQAPATGKLSLRTVPRNFPGRSGTPDDQVCLVSPETATAAALTGRITDPRELDIPYPGVEPLDDPVLSAQALEPPLDRAEAAEVELTKGPNVQALPLFDELPPDLTLTIQLVVGDHLSTDEIMPAGARVLPFRSNIPRISDFVFEPVDSGYVDRVRRESNGHAIVAGENYGQGSSREHAALAPRYLGLQAVIARSFARIHEQNLVSFGVLPLTFTEAGDYRALDRGHTLRIPNVREQLERGSTELDVAVPETDRTFTVRHSLSDRQIGIVLAGGVINWMREERAASA